VNRLSNGGKTNIPAHKVKKSNPILQRLRSKDQIELDLISIACNITEKGREDY
jgi:Xaa-Pro aminopeptidase